MSVAENRQQLGQRLASLATRIRIEGQGVVDLGEDAASVLADLYVPGAGELRMGFWRGHKVWDVWAVHAFAVWGCRHSETWAGAFHGLRKSESPVEEALAEASTFTDPAQWLRIFDENAEHCCGIRDESLALRWAASCLKDRNRAFVLLSDIKTRGDYDPDVWLLVADIRYRLGNTDSEIEEAVANADSAAHEERQRQAVADAWVAYFGDGQRASACMNRGGDRPVAERQIGLLRPNLAWCLAALADVIDALPDWANRRSDALELETLAVTAVFLADDRQLADDIFHRLMGAVSSTWDAVLLATLLVNVQMDFSRAHELIRQWARRATSRENLREMARDWLEDTGDLEGVRILLDAAKPRRLYARPPSDFLEWAKAVRQLLGDAERAADGIREAEMQASTDDFYKGSAWGNIAQAWIDIGAPEEARRAMREGEAGADPSTLMSLARVWAGIGERGEAARCLESVRTRLPAWDDIRVPEICNLAVAWVRVLDNRDEAERAFQSATEISVRGRHWTWMALARFQLGDRDQARSALAKAEESITEFNDILRIAGAWKDCDDNTEMACRVLAKGETIATGQGQWNSLAWEYSKLGDKDGENRCRDQNGR